MEQINGVIDSIYTKTVTTKFGDKDVYHAMINGNDVNLGFKTEFVAGESVNLDVEHKYGGYQYIQPGQTGSVTKRAGTISPEAGLNSTPKASPPAFPLGTNTKDISIIRQSSLNRAVDSVAILIAQGLFVPGIESEYLDKVLEIAYMYTDFGSGQREVKQAAAMEGYED
jgi:hypothetical protein